MHSKITLFTILIAIYIPLSFLDYNHFPYSDGAEHGAAVRELAENLLHPDDPMLANYPGDSPRFVPSIVIMALCMKLRGHTSLQLLGRAAAACGSRSAPSCTAPAHTATRV